MTMSSAAMIIIFVSGPSFGVDGTAVEPTVGAAVVVGAGEGDGTSIAVIEGAAVMIAGVFEFCPV
jgi:hypothetical protein